MKKFDYSFLKEEVPSNILNISEIIADLRAKEEFRRLQYSDTFEKLSKIAVVESVKGSNAIEGIVTTDDRIRDIVNGAAPITHVSDVIDSGHGAFRADWRRSKIIPLNKFYLCFDRVPKS
jgi:Fic family protein